MKAIAAILCTILLTTFPSMIRSDAVNPIRSNSADAMPLPNERSSSSPPFELERIVNFAALSSLLGPDNRARALLKNQGFVVIESQRHSDFAEAYEFLKQTKTPVLITADSLLHLFHVQFSQTLLNIEHEELLKLVRRLSESMMMESYEDYMKSNGLLKESARRNSAFFAVALKLQDLTASIPELIAEDVNAELDLIHGHKGVSKSPIFKYHEDYSQYVPRGHYSRGDDLQGYFKAMMWYGKMSFLLRPGLVSEETAKVQTLQACLIVTSLQRTKIDGQPARDLWDRVYTVTSFFAGSADDLTPLQYQKCIEHLWGSTYPITALNDDDRLMALRKELGKLRRSGLLKVRKKDVSQDSAGARDLDERVDAGMRFMGQRFIPDSHIFQELVGLPYRGNGRPLTMVNAPSGLIRGFPRGLDLMAVMSSQRARQIIEKEGDADYRGYNDQLDKLKKELEQPNDRPWDRNLYWKWLSCLKFLLEEQGQHHPAFMQSRAWMDKQLQTALASWVQMRHDTVLYAKQSYTPSSSMPPKREVNAGYVEPLPQFYLALSHTVESAESILGSMDALTQAERRRFEGLRKVLSRLTGISERELANGELTDADYGFIRDFDVILKTILSGVDRKDRETIAVADVHTDLNSAEVLEEAVGYLDTLIVVYQRPDGECVAAAGPVFSYFEFKWPMGNRLTDEKWKEILQAGKQPERPKWLSGFLR